MDTIPNPIHHVLHVHHICSTCGKKTTTTDRPSLTYRMGSRYRPYLTHRMSTQTPSRIPPVTTHYSDALTLFEKYDPDSESVSKPASKPASKPIAAPVSKPASKPASKPIYAPVSKSIAAPVSKPIAAPVSKPVSKSIAAPIAEPIFKPIAVVNYYRIPLYCRAYLPHQKLSRLIRNRELPQ